MGEYLISGYAERPYSLASDLRGGASLVGAKQHDCAQQACGVREETNMSLKHTALGGASLLLLAALSQPALSQTAPSSPTVQPPPTVVQELVVTAQKRQENINNVGMSIQAATGDNLVKLGVTDTSQLVKIVPGFNYTPTYYGTPVYTIRGVGFQDTSLAGSPTVSVYLDEAPLPFSSLTLGASLDVQRVEVLKGPQGTLFGENATGGAVNYVANKPTDTFQAGVDASYGRFNTTDISGFISGPINDKLEYRVALRTLQSGTWQKSYTHNATNGVSDFWNGRASLLWKPTDKLKVLATVNGWQDRGDTQMGQLAGFGPLNPANPVDPRIIGTGANLSAPGLVNLGFAGHYPFAPQNAQAADWGACVNTSPFDPPFNTSPDGGLSYTPPRPLNSTSCTNFRKNNTYYSGTLRIDYELGNDMTVTSLSGHQQFNRTTPIEGDGTIYQDYESYQRGYIVADYQELRLAGKIMGKGSWLAGANYEHDSTWDQFLQTYGGSSATNVLGIRLGPTRPNNRQQTDTYAFFGNADYPVLENVTVQAGIRYTESKKKYNGCGSDGGDGTWSASSQAIQNLLEFVNGYTTLAQYAAGGPGLTQDQSNYIGTGQGTWGHGINPGPGGCGTSGPAPTFNPVNFSTTLDQDNVSWRVGVNWTVQPGKLVYVNVSQGWKAGGFPTVASSAGVQLKPVVQEGLLAYEAGVKLSLFDKTMQVNGAVFYYDYKDKQILGAINDPIFGALPALVNVPNSHVQGFELSGVWEPVRGLTITPSISYSDSNIDGKFVGFDAFAQLANYGGEPFPNAPKVQADIDAQYEWEFRPGVTAYVGVNVNYQDDTKGFFYDRSQAGDQVSRQPVDALQIPSHTLVDLRAGIVKDAWKFQIWGRNVTDEYYWVAANHVNDVILHYAGMPVTYGATLSYRFR